MQQLERRKWMKEAFVRENQWGCSWSICPSFLSSFDHKGVCCCRRLVAAVVSDSLWPYGLQPPTPRLLCLWDSLGRSTGVGCLALFQGSFRPRAHTPGLLHCRQILYRWATREALICIRCPWYPDLYFLENFSSVLGSSSFAVSMKDTPKDNSWCSKWKSNMLYLQLLVSLYYL